MTAQIISFPPQKTCFTCQHFDPWVLDADDPPYCQLFDRDIVDEVEAAWNCNGYEAQR